MTALIAVAGHVLLTPVATATTTATVTSAAPDRVCLAVTGGPADLCLDARHVDHLGLRGIAVATCTEVEHQGRLVVAESLTRVSARAC